MMKETGKWLDDAEPRARAIRSGIRRSPEGEHAEPIFTSSGFLFDSPEDAAAKFAGESMGMCIRAIPIRLSGFLRSDCVQRDAAGISEGLVWTAVGL